jgi:hypothetical protein
MPVGVRTVSCLGYAPSRGGAHIPRAEGGVGQAHGVDALRQVHGVRQLEEDKVIRPDTVRAGWNNEETMCE